jgi:hypothetical protein
MNKRILHPINSHNSKTILHNCIKSSHNSFINMHNQILNIQYLRKQIHNADKY